MAGNGQRERTWPLYTALFASAAIVTGIIWDISWHRTIGRDTFWSPPHLLEQLAAVVAGTTSGWLVLKTTFRGTETERARSVSVWGFRGPLGAWVCIWGALAMVASAPFDDWWHNAYGLDVKIVSPPHILLAFGIGAIQCGAMLMALAWQNRAAGDRRTLGRLYLIGAGLLLVLASTLAIEYTQRWDMHQANFYQVSAVAFGFFLISGARASVARWPATIIALVYMGLIEALVLILPLFSAQPLLGPIYVATTRFMPPDFPLLVVVPAIAIDMLIRRSRTSPINDWLLAVALGAAFLGTFLAVQWPFAKFLMSPLARNAFFATHIMAYGAPPEFQARYYELTPPHNLGSGLAVAAIISVVSARLALAWGGWMSRVQR